MTIEKELSDLRTRQILSEIVNKLSHNDKMELVKVEYEAVCTENQTLTTQLTQAQAELASLRERIDRADLIEDEVVALKADLAAITLYRDQLAEEVVMVLRPRLKAAEGLLRDRLNRVDKFDEWVAKVEAFLTPEADLCIRCGKAKATRCLPKGICEKCWQEEYGGGETITLPPDDGCISIKWPTAPRFKVREPASEMVLVRRDDLEKALDIDFGHEDTALAKMRLKAALDRGREEE